MDRVVTEELVQVFPVFQTLPADLQNQVMREAKCLTIPEGTTLFDRSSPCTLYPLLLSGSIRVIKLTDI